MTIMPHNPFAWLFVKNRPKSPPSVVSTQQDGFPADKPPCCSNVVHIAYRGISDDRLYLAYDRQWQEVKYFRPKNLRVYCKKCRRRIF